MSDDKPKLYTLKEFAKKYEKTTKFPTTAMLRNWVNNKDKNGFSKVVSKVGKIYLIDEDEFFKWI